MSSQKLSLSWVNKDKAVIPNGNGGFEWAERDDPRLSEVRTFTSVRTVGEATKTASDNLLIHGDSYDALHALVRIPEYAEQYKGKVKLVYIDPPFNTGQAFLHYADALDHSIWLTLMRDRLRLIKQLLASDGSVWVHLDDVEVHRMRLLMDEVFGASSFVATVVWQKRYSRESRPAIGEAHDTILVYSKKPKIWKTTRNKLLRTGAKEYKNPNNDPRGAWRIVPMNAPGTRPNQMYEIEGPDGRIHLPPAGRCWSTIESGYRKLLAEGRIRFGATGKGAPGILRYLDEDEGITPWTWWTHEEVGHNDEGKKEIQVLFPGVDAFSTPKPERLLQRIIHISTKPNDIVLDCFAGSGTTAAVAHKMNRRWVTVEAVQSTVDEFTSVRLSRVVEGADPGGVSSSEERVSAGGLPDGVTPQKAAEALTILNKVIKSGVLDGLDPKMTLAVTDVLKDSLKTKTVAEYLWERGGGFHQLEVSPSAYVQQGQFTLLNESVTGESFIAYVAANLGFRLTNEREGLVGVKGRVRLAVIDGVVDENIARIALLGLDDDETLTIVGRSFMPEVSAFLREKRLGSRVMRAPGDLLTRAAVVR